MDSITYCGTSLGSLPQVEPLPQVVKTLGSCRLGANRSMKTVVLYSLGANRSMKTLFLGPRLEIQIFLEFYNVFDSPSSL